jgi:transcriptional regulator with XRE-family HTH domain
MRHLATPQELIRAVGDRAKDRRLALGRTQEATAAGAGVSRATLVRFEQTGEARFDVIVRIAFALDAQDAFAALFPPVDLRTLDDVLTAARPQRRRVRTKRA